MCPVQKYEKRQHRGLDHDRLRRTDLQQNPVPDPGGFKGGAFHSAPGERPLCSCELGDKHPEVSELGEAGAQPRTSGCKSSGYEFSKAAGFQGCRQARPNRISSFSFNERGGYQECRRESFSAFVTFNLLSTPGTSQREATQ